MKKNRKGPVHAKVMPTSLAGLIALCVTVTLIYWAVDSKFNQLGQEVQKNERELAAETDRCMREEATWKENLTPESLNGKLFQFGLDMKSATVEQIVRLDRQGRPVEGQPSLVKYRKSPKTNDGAVQRIDGKKPEAER